MTWLTIRAKTEKSAPRALDSPGGGAYLGGLPSRKSAAWPRSDDKMLFDSSREARMTMPPWCSSGNRWHCGSRPARAGLDEQDKHI